ncbi:MAG: hypothetical protein H6871_04745 [Methylobacteriaceae bacterium]|nr:hypothetical protein [Methylobacteriaceae bacterium]
MSSTPTSIFFDVDVAILVVEIAARDLHLSRAQEIIYRFGRAYPAGWSESGAALNCPESVEWLGADGAVLAASDYQARTKYLASVCKDQASAISYHWEYLLAPMMLNQRAQVAPVRYRQLEFHRMPTMAWLAVDDPRALTRADFMRLAFASAPGAATETPYAPGFLADFEQRYCYDRFYDPLRGEGWTNTRVLCSGQSFVAIGPAEHALFVDPERGFLSQFRHQYFLLGLIAHFHRAAILMLSDRLVATVSRLDMENNASVSQFRHDIRRTPKPSCASRTATIFRRSPTSCRCATCSACGSRIWARIVCSRNCAMSSATCRPISRPICCDVRRRRS